MNNRRLVARRDDSLRARILDSFELRYPGGFIRAGSALLRVGKRLLAVQDDAYAAAWIEPESRKVTPLILRGRGKRKRKNKKPDFEAAVADGDSLYLLGSGSRENRCSIARVTRNGVSFKEVPSLHAVLKDALGVRPNIEGAVIQRGKLRLFHRDTGGGASAILDLSPQALEGKRAVIHRLTVCTLGAIAGVPLGFSDAAVCAGRILYLAAAENSDNAIADGPVTGTAVGILDHDAARWTVLTESDGSPSRRKAEGVVLNPGGKSGWLLTDPDDPHQPAELCRVELKGPWR